MELSFNISKRFSRSMNLIWQASVVVMVTGEGRLETTALKPSTLPSGAIFRITVFPSRATIESLARPQHKMKTPVGSWPSPSKIASVGKRLICPISLKRCRLSAGSRQKSDVRRRGQTTQLSSSARRWFVLISVPSPPKVQRGDSLGERFGPIYEHNCVRVIDHLFHGLSPEKT